MLVPVLVPVPGVLGLFLELVALILFWEPVSLRLFHELVLLFLFIEPVSLRLFLEPVSLFLFIEPVSLRLFLEPVSLFLFIEPVLLSLFLEPVLLRLFCELVSLILFLLPSQFSGLLCLVLSVGLVLVLFLAWLFCQPVSAVDVVGVRVVGLVQIVQGRATWGPCAPIRILEADHVERPGCILGWEQVQVGQDSIQLGIRGVCLG